MPWRRTVIALLALITAIALIHPVAEVGMNDDWSFIRTAADLASTGKLRYNGWAAPLIGIQAYWGALFIRLFGFSFTVARLSTQFLTLLFIPLLLRLGSAAGLRSQLSLFATLALVLSPLTLISITSFMTDMPAFLLFAGSLLAALECWKTSDNRRATLWLLLTAICGALSGSIRQIYWAAAVWFVFVLAVRRFRNISHRLGAAGCLAATLVFAAYATHWQNAQPFVPGSGANVLDPMPWSEALSSGAIYSLRLLITLAVLLLPATIAFLPRWRKQPIWIVPSLVIGAGLLAFFLAQPLPWLGNTLSQNGVLPSRLDSAGDKTVVLAPLAIWLIATAGIAALAGAALTIRRPSEGGRFTTLSLPFLAVYVSVIIYRGPVFGVYDRYCIPLVAMGIILLLLGYQQLTPKDMPPLAWACLCVFALYGIATTHDSFAGARARLAAATELLHRGIKRNEIQVDFEFDCWTQVDATGYINNGLIQFPAGAYHNAEDCSGSDDLQFWWRSLTPNVQARYVVTLSPLTDLEPAMLLQEPYQTWLPYGTRYAYVQHSKEQLTCQPEH